jgi:acetyl esterase/lipase
MKSLAIAGLVIALLQALVTATSAQAQQQPSSLIDGQAITLWTGAAPGALGTDESDIPALTVYLPRTMAAATPAMIVCPGGAYTRLASNHEGRQVAAYLNSLGMAAFVLRYRLGPRYHHPIGLDPARIGIMGFSAGGHLAMSASTMFDAGDARAADAIDRVSSRPDFAVLAYPVISMSAAWTHQGSRRNLLGDAPDSRLAQQLSGELAVTKDTPQTFIFHTNEDMTVPAENSLQYFLALRRAGVPAELHVFEKGSHGVGLANDNESLAPWSVLLATWLRGRGVIKN